MVVRVIKTLFTLNRTPLVVQLQKCHSLFGLNSLIQKSQHDKYTISPLPLEHHDLLMPLIKRYFLKEHPYVKSRGIVLDNDRAFDEYLKALLKQGNTLYATDDDGNIAGFCVNTVTSSADAHSLRNFAYYRQNQGTKEFLYFLANLQMTSNLWEKLKQEKIFEIKMLAVLPKFRRQGLAGTLVERAKGLADKQGYKLVRFDCMNPFDYKIAERCMMQCLGEYPLRKMMGKVELSSKLSKNLRIRIYVAGHYVEFDNCQWRKDDIEELNN